MRQRTTWLERTLAQLADTLTSDLDAVDYLTMVAEYARELVDGAQIGILLTDAGGMLNVVAASPDRSRLVEVLELQNREGPVLACYRSGEPVVNVLLDERAHDKWPMFTPRATKEGFVSVHALPLRMPEIVLGVLSIFHTQARDLTGDELGLAQSLAHLATLGIVQQGSARGLAHIAEQLQASIDERIAIEQAKGFVAQRLSVDSATASELMRAYGRRTGTVRLGDVARVIIRNPFALEEISMHGVGEPESMPEPRDADVSPGAA